MDIYTIIFLALAVFIFLRLRNVLGQRTGNERPPYDRAARNVVQGAQDNKNVVPMPGAVIDQTPLAPTADVTPPSDRWKGLAEPGSALAQGLDAISCPTASMCTAVGWYGNGGFQLMAMEGAGGAWTPRKLTLPADFQPDSFEIGRAHV